jgi:hypothetical protein
MKYYHTLRHTLYASCQSILGNMCSERTYNTARYKAYENVNAIVLHAQRYKHVHYANCVPPIDPRRIIAFAIDATGRLGPDAKAFLFKRPVVLRPSTVLNF